MSTKLLLVVLLLHVFLTLVFTHILATIPPNSNNNDNSPLSNSPKRGLILLPANGHIDDRFIPFDVPQDAAKKMMNKVGKSDDRVSPVTGGVSGDDAATPCPNGCSDHGACNVTTGVCECFGDYFSLDCSQLACPNNCSGHGECNTSNGKCLCPEPYFNLDCGLMNCPGDCNRDHGVCNHETGVCQCLNNFTGDSCEWALCPNNCSGHGTCNRTSGHCVCEDRYFHDDCSLKACLDPACNGVGTCNTTSGVCECDSMHSGERCELRLCPNNCSYPHGVCNLHTGTCHCTRDWSGDATCSVNINIRQIAKIKNWNTALGTIWVLLVSVGLPFLSPNVLWVQLTIGLVHMMQFIGLSGLIGAYVPPLLLKFCAFFEWSNFIFDLNVRSHQLKQEGSLNSMRKVTSVLSSTSNYFDLRQEMNENGLLVFLDNFILVCVVVILTVIFNGVIIVYRMSKSQQRQKNLEHNLFISFIQLAIMAYLGVASSVMYEIQLAFRGRIIAITLLVSFALLVGYLLGLPLLSVFVVFKRKTDANIRAMTEDIIQPFQKQFKEEFDMFTTVIFAKHFLLGCLFGLFTNSPKDQCVGLLVVLSGYLLILLVTKPFASYVRTMLEIAATIVQMLTTSIILLYSTGLFHSRRAKNFLCVVGIIIPNMVIITVALASIIYSVVYDIDARFSSRAKGEGHILLTEDELHEMGNRTLFDDDDEPVPTTKRKNSRLVFRTDDTVDSD